MKVVCCFMAVLTVILASCAPAVPANGESPPFEMTAVISTVVAETPGPPPTEGPSPTPEPPTPIPTLPSATLSPTELKYRVLEQFPDFFFCDPDFYPIARDDEMTLALQRFPELQANQEEFQAILDHNGLAGQASFSDEEKLMIYREHKKLAAIFFEVVGDRYQFQIQTGMEGQQGSIITGTIDGSGSIEIVQQESSFPTCPICLAAGTRIDTPQGPIPVEDLHTGSIVWTMNSAGERVPERIVRIAHVKAPVTHRIIHVLLSDGRELWASPGHPTADGRILKDLKVGDSLDGAHVMLLERLHYEASATYDLLPSGDTGFYWANEILMGSTLAEP